VVWPSYLLYLIVRVGFINCLHWFMLPEGFSFHQFFICVIFFSQWRAGGSRADGGRAERANFDDTNADRAKHADDTRRDHSGSRNSTDIINLERPF